MPQLMFMDSGYRTDRGRAREANEDAVGTPEGLGITPADVARKGRLYAVCDGMGGQNAGEIASHLAVQTLFQAYYSDASLNPQESLLRAVNQANAAVYAAAQADPTRQDMGTTLVAAVLQGDQTFIASVGDSRVYLISPAGIRQVTTDHTWVQERVTEGTLKPEQAQRHLYRSVLSRALGVKPEVQADFFQERLAPDAALLLCSDGLYTKVSNQEIRSIILSSRTAQSAVGRLVALANQRGGDDNIAVVALRMPGPVSSPTARALTFPGLGMKSFPLWILVAGLVVVVLFIVAMAGLQQLLLSLPGPTPTPPMTRVTAAPTATLMPNRTPTKVERIWRLVEEVWQEDNREAVVEELEMVQLRYERSDNKGERKHAEDTIGGLIDAVKALPSWPPSGLDRQYLDGYKAYAQWKYRDAIDLLQKVYRNNKKAEDILKASYHNYYCDLIREENQAKADQLRREAEGLGFSKISWKCP